MRNKEKHFKEKRRITALLNMCQCYSSLKSEEFHSAGFHTDLSNMEDDNKSNVQYNYCDHEAHVPSMACLCQYDYHLRGQKFNSRNRTWTSKFRKRTGGNMLIVAIITLTLLHGLMAQTVEQTSKLSNDIEDITSKTSSDSITTTGINLVWEPSSDEANPSSITIMKIEATSAPIIQITPTSSTSQKQNTPSSSSIQRDVPNLPKETTSSTSEFVSSVNTKTPQKTSEKKIESSSSTSNKKTNGITNDVNTDHKPDVKEKNIDKMIQKQSELLHDFETKKIKKFDSPSSLSGSSSTTKELLGNGKNDNQGTSSDDNLQIPSLTSSSSSESAEASSLDPTPLDVPTSWSFSNTQTETTMDSMFSKLEIAIESSSHNANEIDLSSTGKITPSSIAPSSFLVLKTYLEVQMEKQR